MTTALPMQHRITIPVLSTDTLSPAIEAFGTVLRRHAPETRVDDVESALEEIGQNAIRHGSAATAMIEASVDTDALTVVWHDDGHRFDTAAAARRAGLPDNRDDGGHGLLLIAAFLNNITWSFQDHRNQIIAVVPNTEPDPVDGPAGAIPDPPGPAAGARLTALSMPADRRRRMLWAAAAAGGALLAALAALFDLSGS